MNLLRSILSRRRRIDHLILVGGPSGVGKSTLIDAMSANTGLRKRFDVPARFHSAFANHLDRLPRKRNRCVLLHYDTMRPFKRGWSSFADDAALEITREADSISAITLVCSSIELRRRMETRWHRAGAPLLHGAYGDPSLLRHWHEAWITHLRDTARDSHRIVAADPSYTELTPKRAIEFIVGGDTSPGQEALPLRQGE
jgi:hypothetical protein